MAFLYTPPSQGLTFKNLQDRIMTFGYNEDERDDIKEWINAAQDEALSRRRWSFLRAAQTITLSPNVQEFNLTSLTVPVAFVNFLQPIGDLLPTPRYVDDANMDPTTDPRIYWDPSDIGVPDRFWREGDVLKFAPIPDLAYSYTLHYWGLAPTMAGAGDLSMIPPRYRWTVLGWGALMYGADNDHNSQLYVTRAQKFEQALEVMGGHEGHRQQQTPRRARLPRSYRRYR